MWKKLIQKWILHLYSVEKTCHTVSMVVIQTNIEETPHLPEIPDVLRPLQSSRNHTLLWAIEHGSNYLWPYTQHKLTTTSCMGLEPEDVTPHNTQLNAELHDSHVHRHKTLGSSMINWDADNERQVETARVIGSQKVVNATGDHTA